MESFKTPYAYTDVLLPSIFIEWEKNCWMSSKENWTKPYKETIKPSCNPLPLPLIEYLAFGSEESPRTGPQ